MDHSCEPNTDNDRHFMRQEKMYKGKWRNIYGHPKGDIALVLGCRPLTDREEVILLPKVKRCPKERNIILRKALLSVGIEGGEIEVHQRGDEMRKILSIQVAVVLYSRGIATRAVILVAG
jgi:hypothetical protein